MAAELSRVVAELSELPAAQQVRGSVSQHAQATRNSTVIQVAGDWARKHGNITLARHESICAGFLLVSLRTPA